MKRMGGYLTAFLVLLLFVGLGGCGSKEEVKKQESSEPNYDYSEILLDEEDEDWDEEDEDWDEEDDDWDADSITPEEMAKYWPGTEYSWLFKNKDGYLIECKMKYGAWIKASDQMGLEIAWHAVGGEGEVPSIDRFNHGSGKSFRSDKSVMTFCTFEMTNQTEGYDFSDEYPSSFIQFTGLSIPCFDGPNSGDPINAAYSDLHDCEGMMFMPEGMEYMFNRSVTNVFGTTMYENHWGPVPVVIAIADVFGPQYGENGNETLDDVYFFAGDNKVYIPSTWKNE